MALINYNKKATCVPTSSACVFWDEGYNTVITQDEIQCNASIGEVTLFLSEKIKDIQDNVDLSLFNAGDFDFDKNTEKVKDLLQKLTTSINTLNGLVESLQGQIDSLKTGSTIELEVDLGCLENEINNCETPPTYSLISLIQLFKDEICLLKS